MNEPLSAYKADDLIIHLFCVFARYATVSEVFVFVSASTCLKI